MVEFVTLLKRILSHKRDKYLPLNDLGCKYIRHSSYEITPNNRRARMWILFDRGCGKLCIEML